MYYIKIRKQDSSSLITNQLKQMNQQPEFQQYVQKSLNIIQSQIQHLNKQMQGVVLKVNKSYQQIYKNVEDLRIQQTKVGKVVCGLQKYFQEDTLKILINSQQMKEIRDQIKDIKQKLNFKQQFSFIKLHSKQGSQLVNQIKNTEPSQADASQLKQQDAVISVIQAQNWVDQRCSSDDRLQFNQNVIKYVSGGGPANILGKKLSQFRRFQFTIEVVNLQTGIYLGIADATANKDIQRDFSFSTSVICYNDKGKCWNGSKSINGSRKFRSGSIITVKVSTGQQLVQWHANGQSICTTTGCNNLRDFKNWVPFICLQGISDSIRIISLNDDM